LFSYVETLCPIGIVVSAPEKLSEDRVIWLLDALGFDMPASEVILQNPDETLFWIVETFGAEDKVGMRHEIGDPLEHTPGLENECWECDL